MMGFVSFNKDDKEKALDLLAEEHIANILDRAVKLFRKTQLHELADKWDRILKNYYSKKREAQSIS
jgi:hypothetical protein